MQHAARETLLDHLHDGGRRATFGLADQQMNVIGHDDISDDHEMVALADLLKNLEEQVATAGVSQLGLPMITAAGEEVQMIVSVVTLEACGHVFRVRRNAEPRSRKARVKISWVRNWESPILCKKRKGWATRPRTPGLNIMDEIKVKNFAAIHPGVPLPNIRHLTLGECESLQRSLVLKLGLSLEPSGLEILKALERRATDIPGVRPSEQSFILSDILKQQRIETKDIYINWSRFDDIDQMSTEEFSAAFHDLWYPSSDDIEIFDKDEKWVVLIRHFDVAQIVRI